MHVELERHSIAGHADGRCAGSDAKPKAAFVVEQHTEFSC